MTLQNVSRDVYHDLWMSLLIFKSRLGYLLFLLTFLFTFKWRENLSLNSGRFFNEGFFFKRNALDSPIST